MSLELTWIWGVIWINKNVLNIFKGFRQSSKVASL